MIVSIAVSSMSASWLFGQRTSEWLADADGRQRHDGIHWLRLLINSLLGLFVLHYCCRENNRGLGWLVVTHSCRSEFQRRKLRHSAHPLPTSPLRARTGTRRTAASPIDHDAESINSHQFRSSPPALPARPAILMLALAAPHSTLAARTEARRGIHHRWHAPGDAGPCSPPRIAPRS